MQAAVIAADTFEEPSSIHHGLPRTLLPLAGGRVIDHLAASLFSRGWEGTVHLCTGPGGYAPFREWLRGCDFTGRVSIFESETASSGDVSLLRELVLKKGIRESVLVLGGESFLDLPLASFAEDAGSVDGDVVGISTSRRAGGTRARMTLTAEGRVIDLGTPDKGRNGVSILPLAKVSSETLSFAGSYLAEGGDPSSIVRLLERSYRVRPLYALAVAGRCHPLTCSRSLKKISSLFEKKV